MPKSSNRIGRELRNVYLPETYDGRIDATPALTPYTVIEVLTNAMEYQRRVYVHLRRHLGATEFEYERDFFSIPIFHVRAFWPVLAVCMSCLFLLLREKF